MVSRLNMPGIDINRGLASASSRQLLQHMSDEYALSGKFRPVFHQPKEHVFPVLADEGHIRQINDYLPVPRLSCGFSPGAFYFRGPRRDQLAFYHQPPLPFRLDD
jgi:hypothetical protein